MILFKKQNYIVLSLFFLTLFSCQKDAKVSTDMEEHFYIRNGSSDMPAWVYGNGESKVLLVALHGGPGGGGLPYRRSGAYRSLEDKYAVVYWDQRVQGNSHGHLKEEDVTIDKMTDDLHLLVKTLKKRYGEDNSIFFLAHSWGGGLGTAFLVKEDFQDDINGWINVDGGFDIHRQNVAMMDMVNTIGQDELNAGNSTSFWQGAIDYTKTIDTNNITFDQFLKLNGYGHDIEDHLLQINPKIIDDGHGITDPFFSPYDYINAIWMELRLPKSFIEEEFGKLNFTPQLSKIKIPSLIIYGKYDFVCPPILGQIMYNNISSTEKELKIYDKSAHSPMGHEIEKFKGDVTQFIETYK